MIMIRIWIFENKTCMYPSICNAHKIQGWICSMEQQIWLKHDIAKMRSPLSTQFVHKTQLVPCQLILKSTPTQVSGTFNTANLFLGVAEMLCLHFRWLPDKYSKHHVSGH